MTHSRADANDPRVLLFGVSADGKSAFFLSVHQRHRPHPPVLTQTLSISGPGVVTLQETLKRCRARAVLICFTAEQRRCPRMKVWACLSFSWSSVMSLNRKQSQEWRGWRWLLGSTSLSESDSLSCISSSLTSENPITAAVLLNLQLSAPAPRQWRHVVIHC